MRESRLGDWIFKGLPLLALVFVLVRYPATIGRFARAAVHGAPSLLTLIDMGTARDALVQDYLLNDRWTSNLAAVLRASLAGRENPEADRWGTPLRLEGLPNEPALVSCGPDRECGGADDLRVPLIQKKKSGERDDHLEGVEG